MADQRLKYQATITMIAAGGEGIEAPMSPTEARDLFDTLLSAPPKNWSLVDSDEAALRRVLGIER